MHEALAYNFQDCFRTSYNKLFRIEKQELNTKMDFMPVNNKKRTEVWGLHVDVSGII